MLKLPSDDPGRAALEVVAHQRLLLVDGAEVLEVAAAVVHRAGLLALHLRADERADEHGVLAFKGKQRLTSHGNAS